MIRFREPTQLYEELHNPAYRQDAPIYSCLLCCYGEACSSPYTGKLADLFFNALTEFARAKPELQLVLYIFQDVLIVISMTVMFVSLFSTYVFQAGLVELLFDKFRFTILISVLYLIVTISLHIWLLTERWNEPLKYDSSHGLNLYFIFQRMLSPLYYYSMKRAILRVSDSRFYQSLSWITEKLT